MDFNEKQKFALEGIYRTARIYIKIAAELNELADDIKLEAEEDDGDEFMKVFVRSKVEYAKDVMRLYSGLPGYTNDRLNDLNDALLKDEES